MTHLTTLAITLAGISWKPEIRGVLTVVIAVAILCGSVVLLLGTNMGTRLGFLVALTGLFGWMTILGGVGCTAKAPSARRRRQVIEINTGDLSQAQLEEISSDPDSPTGGELPASGPDRAEAQATVDAELTQSDNACFNSSPPTTCPSTGVVLRAASRCAPTTRCSVGSRGPSPTFPGRQPDPLRHHPGAAVDRRPAHPRPGAPDADRRSEPAGDLGGHGPQPRRPALPARPGDHRLGHHLPGALLCCTAGRNCSTSTSTRRAALAKAAK